MSKYIIELDDRIKLVTSVGVTEHGVVYTTSDYVHNLEELNSDYINEHYGELQDAAYQKGYDAGIIASSFVDKSDEAYQRGLKDAWDAAQKIMDMPDPPYWDVFCEYKNELFKKLSAPEVIAKLKAYEDSKQPMYDIQAALKCMASEAEMSITEPANRIKDMYK